MRLITVILLTFIVACQPMGEQEESKVDFFDDELLFNRDEPVLNIYYQSDECGEWGGHEEKIVISRKNSIRLFELAYQEYNVNCDSMVKEYGQYGYNVRPFRELVRTKRVTINEPRKRAILNFSTDMVKSKFSESFPGHSGVILMISNSDSTFLIRTWGGSDEHYQRFVDNLELDRNE